MDVRDGQGGIHQQYRTTEPEWSCTVPRLAVHRAAIAEVFLTSLTPTADPDRYLIGAQWPRAHTFYGPDTEGRHDVMIVPESLRQSGLLIAHSCYGVPLGHSFVMCDMHFRLLDAQLLMIDGTPTNVVLDVTCWQPRTRRGELRSATMRLKVLRGAAPVAVAWAKMLCLSPETAQALRPMLRPHLPPEALPSPGNPVDPARVGRRDLLDVLLADPPGAPTGGRASWPILVNASHPVLFDHPLDHLPGMAQLEVARQAALALTGSSDGHVPLVTAYDGVFSGFIDLATQHWCHAERIEPDTVAITIGGAHGATNLTHGVVTLTHRLPRREPGLGSSQSIWESTSAGGNAAQQPG